MSGDLVKSNRALIRGVITENFVYSHETLGEKFFSSKVRVYRNSGTPDLIPVIVPECLVDPGYDFIGCPVEIYGQIRTYNKSECEKRRLLVYLFVIEIRFLDEIKSNIVNNLILLDGYICKDSIYRKTPLGREIVDLLLAVNRPYGKSDYIPCIVWEGDALWACKLGVGTKISLKGRIQSREYIKKLPDGTFEERTAYEVSVSRIDVV